MDNAWIFKILLALTLAIGCGIFWKILLSIFAQKVEIKVNKNKISFISKAHNIKISPCVYITKLNNKYQLAGIGNPPTTDRDFVTVNILNPAGAVASNAELEECIEAFFRSASYKLFNRKLFLFTVATVSGSEKFKKSLGYNWQESLDKCLKISGCIKRNYI